MMEFERRFDCILLNLEIHQFLAPCRQPTTWLQGPASWLAARPETDPTWESAISLTCLFAACDPFRATLAVPFSPEPV